MSKVYCLLKWLLFLWIFDRNIANCDSYQGNLDQFGVRSSLIQLAKSKDEVGINLAADIYESICWLEYLKLYLPNTRSLKFNQCHGQANFQRNVVMRHGAPEKYFGKFLYDQEAMRKLPSEYMTCIPFLLEGRHRNPIEDYSFILSRWSEVAKKDFTFPYKAFIHCMIQAVHQKYKDEGLRVIQERLTKDTSWTEAMFRRENEFRGLHRAKPLVLNDELTFRAQKWANQLARDCQMYHIHAPHPDYLLNGSRMGENLFTGDNIHSPMEDMALFGTNIWYEEIGYYPWPEYTGFGEDPFLKFSHFSQMIWKESEMVGYGYAVNSSSNCGQYFIVSRYFPPGNFWGQFKENILPLSN